MNAKICFQFEDKMKAQKRQEAKILTKQSYQNNMFSQAIW